MRLFVGLALPDEIKDELAALIEALRPAEPDAKWVPRDNLHLTFSFLGEVGDQRIGAIADAVRGAAGDVPGPIATRLDGSGAFPSARRARVLWVGLHDPGARIASLANAVASALEPLGFSKEKRPWTAHLTVARMRAPANVERLLQSPVAARSFEVGDVTLFRSRLARPAPRYEALETFGLAGAD